MTAIQEKLDALKAHVDSHMDTAPEMVNWGHVGSAKHLLRLLKEASQFEGLEAPE